MDPRPHIADDEGIHPEQARARSRIGARRRALGYSQDDLAYMTGVSALRIRRMEAGNPVARRPDLRSILTLAMALQCDSVEDVIEDWFWPEPPVPPHADSRLRHGEDV